MIDILHPAHVHFFKHIYRDMTGRGHQVLVTARRKDCALALLAREGIPHEVLSESTTGLAAQAGELVSRTLRFAGLARRFRPDALAGIMGPTIALAGRLLQVPTYVFYDTEMARVTNRFVYPLATRVVTPACYEGRVRGQHTRYHGFHELAYLHPDRFQPDRGRVRDAGIDPDRPYVVVRFVGWWASHDHDQTGLPRDAKIALVRELARRCRVVVSSEAAVPAELEPHLYRGPVEDMHHVLAFASACIGESATMISEAAVLGVPGVYVADLSRGYLNEEARYGMVRVFRCAELAQALLAAHALLDDPDATRRRIAGCHRRMLGDMIDVTSYAVGLLEGDHEARQQRMAA